MLAWRGPPGRGDGVDEGEAKPPPTTVRGSFKALEVALEYGNVAKQIVP